MKRTPVTTFTRLGAALRRRLSALAAVPVLALALGLLAGCSGGGSDESQADGGLAAQDAPEAASREAGGGDAMTDEAGKPARVEVQVRKVISTGHVTLEADDLGAVRDQIARLLGRFGGYVGQDETVNDDDGRTQRSTMTLRVPSQHFDTVMAEFARFSTVTDTSREEVDVTTEVIDVDARIRTQEVSLGRLRRFLGDAVDVNAMIRLESEIAQREADLASLRAQQDYLDDQTSLATITVGMTRPDAEADADPDPLADAGFLTGLRSGWNALLDILVVAATVAGALVPFAVVLVAVGLPLVLWLRTNRRRRTAPPPASA